MVYYDSKVSSGLKPSNSYISSKPLTIARKSYREAKAKHYNIGWKRYVVELLYTVSSVIYVSIYFYLMPFIVIIYPTFYHAFVDVNERNS